MGIKEKLPLINSETKVIRIVGYVVYAFVFLMILGALVPSPDKTVSVQDSTPASTSSGVSASTPSVVQSKTGAAGLSPSEEKDLTSRAMSVLGGAGGVYASEVNVGSDASLDITVVTLKADSDEGNQKNIYSAIASTVGIYLSVVDMHPAITDLRLTLAGTDWVPAATLYCKRSWIDSVRTNPDGTRNQDDIVDLLTKTGDTMKLVSSETRSYK